MRPPYQTRPDRPRGSALSGGFLPLALITLGVAFLLGNLVPERARGGLFIFGLGAAFLIGRLTTGRYGYATPAGVLMAIGAYLSLQHTFGTSGAPSAGEFFVLLGLGFAVAYLAGMRPSAVWPLFPAAILVGLGLVLIGVSWLGPLASLSWIVAYWPVALILIGIWVIFREALPMPVRRPVATLGGLGLLAYGILAAAASVASGGALSGAAVAPGFGASPYADAVTLELPIAAGQTLTVDNPTGQTTIRGSDTQVAHVVATRHYGVGGQPAEVHLAPAGDGLNLNATILPTFGSSNWVDYEIDIPADAAVKAHANSGSVNIDDTSGAVTVDSNSGSMQLANLRGPVQVSASSGSIKLENVGGDLTAHASSGSIQGSGLANVRDVSTTSGYVSLEGIFTESGQVHASSGTIKLQLLPGSNIQLDAHTGTGSVVPEGDLSLSGGSVSLHNLTGAFGSPAQGAVLRLQTDSGSILISQ
jgi:putative adhesin